MKDILQEIVAHKREELSALFADHERFVKTIGPMKAHADAHPTFGNASMKQALLQSGTGIIAEFKRRSPSKGWIQKEARASIVPLQYQQGGATALSILTDEDYFGGRDEFICAARQSGVTLPILYKNFVIDPHQLVLAHYHGANAVLLIAACLTKNECASLIREAHGMGLEVLLEMHDESELEYAELEPDMCGINNRHLGSFVTDVETSFRLAERLPKDAVKVSESGISNPQTVHQLRQAGFHGFLIGETFMKTSAPGEALSQFIKAI